MKRDMDLVREILLRIEDAPGFAPKDIEVDGHSEASVAYHIYLLIDAGFVEGIDTTRMGSGGPTGLARRMTWEGHEFLDAAREPERWGVVKKMIGKIGGATLPVWATLLENLRLEALGLSDE